MDKIVGLIGCGRWGTIHLSTLLSMKEQGLISKVVVCDTDPKKIKNLSQKVDRIYSDFFQMIEENTFDLVAIATPPSTHVEIAEPLLQRGIKLLVEKPLGQSFADLERLTKASLASSTPFFSGYLLRHHSGFQLLKNRLKSPQHPPLKSLHFFRHSTRECPKNTDVIRTLASHAVDLVSFFNLHHSTPVLSSFPFHSQDDARTASQAKILFNFPNQDAPVEVFISVGWGFEKAKREAHLLSDKTVYTIDFNTHDSVIEETASTKKRLLTHSTELPLQAQYKDALYSTTSFSELNSHHLQTAALLELICQQVQSRES